MFSIASDVNELIPRDFRTYFNCHKCLKVVQNIPKIEDIRKDKAQEKARPRMHLFLNFYLDASRELSWVPYSGLSGEKESK